MFMITLLQSALQDTNIIHTLRGREIIEILAFFTQKPWKSNN